MGAGTTLGLHNASLQYQQHNASHVICISSSAEHKEDSKTQNLNDFQLWASFLELSTVGITDVLYLETYEELRNLVFTSIKTVILTHKNIFGKTHS